MLDLLVRRQAKNPELGLDMSALRNEAATIFMAGHEGTTATLTWAFYLLSNAPWVEEALLHEIKTVVGNRRPSMTDVSNLKSCRAVIEETLRLFPSIPVMAPVKRTASIALARSQLSLMIWCSLSPGCCIVRVRCRPPFA
jgi:cytochrome P450